MSPDIMPEIVNVDQVDEFVDGYFDSSGEESLDTDEEEDLNFYDLYGDHLSSRSSSPLKDTPWRDDASISDEELSDSSENGKQQPRRHSHATIRGRRRQRSPVPHSSEETVCSPEDPKKNVQEDSDLENASEKKEKN